MGDVKARLKSAARTTGKATGRAAIWTGKQTGRGLWALLKRLPWLLGQLIKGAFFVIGRVLMFFFTGSGSELVAKWAVLLFFFAGWAFLAGKIQMSDQLSQLVGYIIAGTVLVAFVKGLSGGGRTKRP